MKTAIKMFVGFLIGCALLGGVMNFLWRRSADKRDYVAFNAPVRTLSLPLPFPTDLIYQSSPDSTVLIGTRSFDPDSALFAISAFDRKTARKLWQLPFAGNRVGQTDRQLLVYEVNTATVYFIDPRSGQCIRKISPEPAPLTSPSSLYRGMAFTDALYLTTKPLYGQVVVNGKIDTTWRIGITAKTWETDETKWFLPPVKQIVIIEYQPIVSGDKVLIVNPQQKIGEGHSYQLVSLETGRERHRSVTEGTYFPLEKDRFFERTNTFVRRLDPFTQQEIWRLGGLFSFGNLWLTGEQLSILARRPDGSGNTMWLVRAGNGQLMGQFDLPFFKDSAIKGAYLTHDRQLLLHFAETNFSPPGTLLYDYWVSYDPNTQQARWRTGLHSESLSSLLSFIPL